MSKTLINFLIIVIDKFLPTKTIATFFGVGYLPAWQSHWAALLALVIANILFYLIYGFDYLNVDITDVFILKAAFFLYLSIILLVLGVVSVFIFQQNNKSASSSDIISWHFAFGQLLTSLTAAPASVSIYYALAQCYDTICKSIFTCPVWLNALTYFFILFIIPFVFFAFFVVIKPWPISSLQLEYNNSFSILCEGITYAFYATMTLYMVAFVFFDLTMLGAIGFMKYLFYFF